MTIEEIIMPSLLNETVAANYSKFNIENGTNGRTLIVKFAKSNITNAELKAWVNYLTTAHGDGGTGDSAFTVAGVGTADGSAFVSGDSDVVILALQGTGEFTDSTVQGLTGTPTVDILAVFDQGR